MRHVKQISSSTDAATYTVGGDTMFLVDLSSEDVTLTLPSAENEGQEIVIFIQTGSATYDLVVTPQSGETVAASSTWESDGTNSALWIVADGASDWVRIYSNQQLA